MDYWRRRRDNQSRKYELINGFVGSLWEFGVPVVLVVNEVGHVWVRIILIVIWMVKIGPIGYNTIPGLTNPLFDRVCSFFKRDKRP